MSLASRIQELFQERRRDERERVLISAHLRVGDENVRAVLLNLSRAGAMLASVSPPPVGTAVRLFCEDLDVPAKVAWNKGYQFGLAFTRRIDETQLKAVVLIAGGKGAGR